MIQRVQTLYFLATVILSVLMLCLPFATLQIVSGNDTETMKLTAFGVKQYMESNSTMVARTTYFGILLTLILAVAVLITFSYKKRWFQIRMSLALMIMEVGAQIFVIYYLVKLNQSVNMLSSDMSVQFQSYAVTDIFPLICIILTWLGYRGVVKDEALIQSLNRIR